MGIIVVDGFPLATFFVDEIRRRAKLDDLTTRFRLNMAAIQTAETVGYWEDEIPAECKQPNPPKWCWLARGVVPDIAMTLVSALAANGHLTHDRFGMWNTFAVSGSFIEFAPSLFREIGRVDKSWTAERALEVLDRTFVAVSDVARPAPGGETEWEAHCREHPTDPICLMGSSHFTTPIGRQIAQTLLVSSALWESKLLKDDQLRTIYDASYGTLTAGSKTSDIDLVSGGVITDGLALDKKVKMAITASLAGASVGLIDPDSPLAEQCDKPNPPPICRSINVFPIATKLTTELVRHEIWSADQAEAAWTRLARTLDSIGTFEPEKT